MIYSKENITTYATGIILAITTYFGVSESTSSLIVQIIAPIIAIILPIIVTYFNEKYPSNIVTTTYTAEDVEQLATTIIEDKTTDEVLNGI